MSVSATDMLEKLNGADQEKYRKLSDDLTKRRKEIMQKKCFES